MASIDNNYQKNLLLITGGDGCSDELKAYLCHCGFCLDNHANGEILPVLLERRQKHVDLVVLGADLPGKGGLYWLKWLHQYNAHIPVIMMTDSLDKDKRLLWLENGAHDYLLKPFHGRELLIRIENILGSPKKHNRHRDNIRIGDVKIDTQEYSLVRDGQKVKLTQLEFKIIQLLYLHAGQPLTREDFMKQIRGVSFNPQDRTIDIHISKLRAKLEKEPSRPVYIRTVRGKGYSLHLPW